jgi:hypothetical protein
MNAYELAEIMTTHDGSQVWEHGLEIATMLRQQADRIAELEHMNKNWSISEGLALQRIAELEKQFEHSVGADCREMRYIQEIENKDARIAELEKELEGCEYFLNKDKSGNSISAEEYQKTHEGFSTIIKASRGEE